jgi:nucleoside-diphosphate-sugar epimerase
VYTAKAMKVLLTGGSGFLGSYVAEQLCAEGHTVRALVRPRSDRRVLQKLGACEFAPGAIEDPASLVKAVEGVEGIVHVAGIVKARNAEEFFAVNTQGTRNLVEAALARGGLKRFVYVSSLAAVGPSADGTPVAENAEPHPVTAYGRSKLEAERAVLAVADRMPVTVIRPPMIYGPRDRETLAFFTSVRNGVLPMMGDGGNTLSVIYAPDCAAAIVRAVSSNGAPSGRAYFVEDGSVYVWREALKEIESAMGKRAFVRVGLPMQLIQAAAAATQLWGKVTGTAQMLTLDKVKELKQRHWVCSGDGARKDLGWSPKVGWAQGVQEAVKWYRAEGWL